jgi:hypothetical protein
MRVYTAIIGALLLFWAMPSFPAEDMPVLARVGEQAITLQEFLDSLPMLAVVSPEGDVEAGKRKLLDSLITRLLYAQEAIRLGLHEDPRVKALLKLTQESLLAQEYLRRQMAERSVVGADDVQRYYELHRERFEGKALAEVAGEIRAKLQAEVAASLPQTLAAELRQRQQIVIDEELLRQVVVPGRPAVKPNP